MTTATKAPARDEWAAVYESLPTVAEGWATAKAVAEVVELSPATVTRRLNALEEGGRVESSVDKAVTGARGRVWRQRADRPRVVGGIETVELPVADVEPDPVQRYVDAAEGGVFDEVREDADPVGRDCEQCGEAIHPTEAEAGYTQCEKCDPDGEQSVHGPAAAMSDDDANEAFDGLPISMLANDGEGDGPVTGCACEDCDELAEANAGDPTAPLVDEEDGDPSPVSPAPTGGDVAAIAEWMSGQRPADPLSAQDARALTDRIRIQVSDLLPLIKEAYTRRADLALGYESWAAYCDTELRGLRMPLAERQTATAELRAEGLSTRAIAGALGSSDATVRRDLAATGATDDAPDRATGLDGRSYPARKPPKPEPETPNPLRVRAHAWQIMNVNALVWIATSRMGIDYHRPADDDRSLPSPLLTGCGRSMRTGERLSVFDVENELSATPCPRCWPEDWQPAAPGDTPGQLVPGEADIPQPVDGYEPDPAARIAAVAELAPEYVEQVPAEPALEGEVLPAAVDPGPVPDPPPLDPRTADAITTNLGGLALAIGNLATLLRDAGPHAGSNLHTLRHWRHELDLCIRLAERA